MVIRNTSPYLLVETEELVYTVESLGELRIAHMVGNPEPGKIRIAHLDHDSFCPQWPSLAEPSGYSSASPS